MSEERVTRTYKEIKEEANIVYNDLMKYLKKNHGHRTTLSIQIATGTIALKMWKTLILENDNEREKEFSEEVMNRMIEYIIAYRVKSRGEKIDELIK